MKEILLAFVSQYGLVIVFGIVASLLTFTASILPLVYQGFQYLKTLADKNLSEKVAARIKDATDKLYSLVALLIESESKLLREDLLLAIADGKIDTDEVKKIKEDIANKAIEILSPEVATLKKYLTGPALLDYVVATTTSFLVKYAKDYAAKKSQVLLPSNPVS